MIVVVSGMGTKTYPRHSHSFDIVDVLHGLTMCHDNITLWEFYKQYPELFQKLLDILSLNYPPYRFFGCVPLEPFTYAIRICSSGSENNHSFTYKTSADMPPAMFVEQLITFLETNVINLKDQKKSEDTVELKVHRCTQCGAVLKKGQTVCDYCLTEFF